MRRFALISLVVLAAALAAGHAVAHDGHDHGGGAGTQYYAVIDDFHSDPSTTDATGEIFLTLNPERTELSYRIVLDGLLNLKPNPEDRTEPDDIIGIHLHLFVPDTVGPHILNIFGLATYNYPAEEDADLVIDYPNNTLTGIYDISDATIDPETGQPAHQFFPLTTKIIDDWLDELDAGLLMVGIHTNETGFPTMAIHGHIAPVPEPATCVLALTGFAMALLAARRSSGKVLCKQRSVCPTTSQECTS